MEKKCWMVALTFFGEKGEVVDVRYGSVFLCWLF